MSASIRPVAVTVTLKGKTVELQLGEDALFGRASHGKYAYAVGCERLFGLLGRHGIRVSAGLCDPDRLQHSERLMTHRYDAESPISWVRATAALSIWFALRKARRIQRRLRDDQVRGSRADPWLEARGTHRGHPCHMLTAACRST
ncbi:MULTISPECIES: hypothetical protein [unclassified Bradyrhizobium]|uniref:hypothetical protein n=1 Tax=unclassified Bradyrhizobium TaxID=2631580 RepID=UPI002012EF31|nr:MULTISPECIES: hypothetical protein [unclassified Bradyrhizobium]